MKIDPLGLYGAILATILGGFKIREEVHRLRGPQVSCVIYEDIVHAKDGSRSDMAIKILIDNPSSVNRTLVDCSVGLLTNPGKTLKMVAREAQLLDGQATFPIQIPPYSSQILYSFARRLESVFPRHPDESEQSPLPVVIRAEFSGKAKLTIKEIGTYSHMHGLRAP